MSRYAVINTSTSMVENVILWSGGPEWAPPDGYIAIETDSAEIGWSYINEEFVAPEPEPIPGPTNEELARLARIERDNHIRAVYDPGIMMALRALRTASTQAQTSYAQGKVSELDAYVELLLAIPNQPGFPQTITWPVAPTK